MLPQLALIGALWTAAGTALPRSGSSSASDVQRWVNGRAAGVSATTSAEQVAWLIWGRRGAARKVVTGSTAWPQGLLWGTDGTDVSRWGRVTLGETRDTASTLRATAGAKAAVADGIFSDEEWDLSAASIAETPVGPLVVAAQQAGEFLQVCALLPAANVMSGATKVIITAARPSGDPAVGVALQWDPRLEVCQASVGALRGRSWTWQQISGQAESPLGTTGAVSPNGDGSWQFVTAEATFPKGVLGLKDRGDTAALAVFVLNLPRAHCGEDAIYWPAAHGHAIEASECMLCENPDGWGAARPGSARARRTEITLPALPAAPRIDGQIEDGEWAVAAELRNDFLGLAQCHLRAGLNSGTIYLAASCNVPRQGLSNPRLEIFVDPAGDGGLLPRPDDRMVCLSHDTGGTTSTLFRWEPPEHALADGVVTKEGRWMATAPVASQAAYRLEANKICVEAALPLDVLGLAAERLPDKFGLLVRLLYRWHVDAK